MTTSPSTPKLGLRLPHFGTDITVAKIVEVAELAEKLSFDSVWVSDHLVIPARYESMYPFRSDGRFPVPADALIIEPLCLLAYLSAAVRRVELGVSALVVPHRHPMLAAKMFTTLDFLSAGRLIIGVGIGWLREEFEALGAPFEERARFTTEAMELLRRVFEAEDSVTFRGEFVDVREVFVRPAGAGRGTPPVWVTGYGELAAEAAASYGDAWHFHLYGASPERVRTMSMEIARLVGGDRRVGLAMYLPIEFSKRDPDPADSDQLPWRLNTVSGTTGYLANVIRTYRDLGVDHFVLRVGDPSCTTDVEAIWRFHDEVKPLL